MCPKSTTKLRFGAGNFLVSGSVPLKKSKLCGDALGGSLYLVSLYQHINIKMCSLLCKYIRISNGDIAPGSLGNYLTHI